LAIATDGAAAAGDATSAWETHCETPPGAASEQCAVVQSVVDDQRPNITLVIIALKTADHKSRLLRVIAPLGALIPTGLNLKLDADDVGRMAFMRCLPNGCVAETLIDDKLLQRLETAQTMTLVLFQTPEEGIGVPAPMAGFKDAFEKLP
jgi:invasion protein IalB